MKEARVAAKEVGTIILIGATASIVTSKEIDENGFVQLIDCGDWGPNGIHERALVEIVGILNTNGTITPFEDND